MGWLPKDTVVVSTDFSEASMEAVHAAQSMVRDVKNLHVIHVIELTPDLDPNVFGSEDRHEKRKHETRDKLRQTLNENGLSDARAEIIDDLGQRGPGATIAEYADKQNADLVVVSTHGYSGLKRLAMGSVAEQVVRHTERPVLLLHR